MIYQKENQRTRRQPLLIGLDPGAKYSRNLETPSSIRDSALHGLDDIKPIVVIAAIGITWFLFSKKDMKKNPGRKRSQYARTFEGDKWWNVGVERDRSGRITHSIDLKARTASAAKNKAKAMGWPVYKVEQDDD